jgi:CheY-like chemotaxis protein
LNPPTFAANLNEPLSTARSSPPEIVLLDIGMPQADGYEVARRMRELQEMPEDVAYIAVTGFGRPEDFVRSADARFFRHLLTPVDPALLDAVLQGALAIVRRDS